MNGCSKRRSHRALHPVLDLYQSFAAIPRCIGRKLVNKVQKNLSSGNGGAGQACLAHPCVETWGRYRACLMATDLYRPSSGAGGSAASASGFAFSKCIPAATAHMRCVKLNKDWAPPEPADVTHTLESFRVFRNSGRNTRQAFAPSSSSGAAEEEFSFNAAGGHFSWRKPEKNITRKSNHSGPRKPP
eukprot:GHVT01027922.1.p1 GENE.GHVT01027922.1~~GHVT01027922.1.p1  ORF type:complete len:187 (-),score=33.50 GHVT01027922.1:148-708(-)